MNTTDLGALKGIRVIELGQLIAGPFCGQLLGDMGAEVIKVESPGTKGRKGGDPMREWGQGKAGLWWEIIARNKKSVSANLRLAEGQDLVLKLIANADILIENFRPGTLEKWGLAPEILHKLNPRLIIVRVSGYGQSGPYAARAGYGGIGEAMGGWRNIVGDQDRPPSRMGVSIGDSLAASYACMGALAALHARERTGEGQIIDCAIYEAVLQVMESLIPEYTVAGHIRERTGSILEGIAPSNVYLAKDGHFLIGANQDTVFARLCEAMGKEGLVRDERFASHEARGRYQRELDEIISDWTRTLTIVEIERLMVNHAIPAGRIYRAPEMLNDPHFDARKAIVDVKTDTSGMLKMQNAFPFLSETPSTIRSPAPAEIGQHNAEIYGTLLGLDKAELEKLRQNGVI